MSRYQQFLDAKAVIRNHPGWTDEQVAEQIGVKAVDTGGMHTIKQARKDVAAGDTTQPG